MRRAPRVRRLDAGSTQEGSISWLRHISVHDNFAVDA
jgi:hypothetical protein